MTGESSFIDIKFFDLNLFGRRTAVLQLGLLFVPEQPKKLALGLFCFTEFYLFLNLAFERLALGLLELLGVQVEAG